MVDDYDLDPSQLRPLLGQLTINWLTAAGVVLVMI